MLYCIFPLLRDTSCFKSGLFPLLLVTERILSGSMFSRMFCFSGDCTLKQALYQAPIPVPGCTFLDPQSSTVVADPSHVHMARAAVQRSRWVPAPLSLQRVRSRAAQRRQRRRHGVSCRGAAAASGASEAWAPWGDMPCSGLSGGDLFSDPSFGLV